MATEGSNSMLIIIILGVVGLFGIITFSLSAATLGTLNKHYGNLDRQLNDLRMQVNNISNSLQVTPTTPTPTPTPTTPPTTTTITTAATTVDITTGTTGTEATTLITTPTPIPGKR